MAIYTQALVKKLNEALVIDWAIEWSDRDNGCWEADIPIITTWTEREADIYTVFGFVGFTNQFGGIDIDQRYDGVLEQGFTSLMDVHKRCMALETFWKSKYPEYEIA